MPYTDIRKKIATTVRKSEFLDESIIAYAECIRGRELENLLILVVDIERRERALPTSEYERFRRTVAWLNSSLAERLTSLARESANAEEARNRKRDLSHADIE